MVFGAKSNSVLVPQYWEYSSKDFGERINGGAVKELRSPLYEAMEAIKDAQVEA